MSEFVSSEKELSPKQTQLLAKLVSGMSIDAASKAVGVSDRQAHRWLILPHFQKALKEAKDEQFNSSLDLLQQASSAAIRVLINLMKDTEPSAIRLRAATVVFENSVEVRKVAQLEQRIADLEKLLKDK